MTNAVSLKDFNQIDSCLFELPKKFRNDMRVPAHVYANRKMLESIKEDKSLWQLANMATLPGIEKAALAMPDIHQGYGFPIGGVLATRLQDGVISPGGVGYDINCGVRLLITPFSAGDIQLKLQSLLQAIARAVPAGTGKGTGKALSMRDLDQVLASGAEQVVGWGFGCKEDLEATESFGKMNQAKASLVSKKAKDRGKDQLGSLGSGNHFLEFQQVAEIYDQDIAHSWGFERDRVVVMFHTGSRGLGHQTCDDYVSKMIPHLAGWDIRLPDRDLACAPLQSEQGQEYLGAMAACANFAWANRQMITHQLRSVFQEIMGEEAARISVLYDVAHNIAKVEAHEVNGKRLKLCVHRKGATRAFPKGHPELPVQYQETGQPVIIPGTMGTCSFVLTGTNRTMSETFGTVSHGAGRAMSRHQAKRQTSGEQTRRNLEKQGIHVWCDSSRGLAEEAPFAYKDVNQVVDVLVEAGLARKVARVVPLGVLKGG